MKRSSLSRHTPLRKASVKRKKAAVRVFTDGREVVHRARIYMERTEAMAKRQKNKCAMCMLSFAIVGRPTFDHEAGRGMGGGHRDDRIEVNGKWQNAALCVACNGLKGSRRFHWVNGSYIPAVYIRREDWLRCEPVPRKEAA